MFLHRDACKRMKLPLDLWSTLGVLAGSTTLGRFVLAANSFAGSNLYYAAGLSPDDRETLLQYVHSLFLAPWRTHFFSNRT